MGTDKRLFLFLIISLFVLFAFQTIFAPKKSQMHEQQAPALQEGTIERSDTSFASRSVESIEDLSAPISLINESQEDLKTYESDDFIITYSLAGGYIKKILLKKYNEELLYTNLFIMPSLVDEDFVFTETSTGFSLSHKSDSQDVVKEFSFGNQFELNVDITSSSDLDQGMLLFTQTQDTGMYNRYQEYFYGSEQLTRIAFNKIKKPYSLDTPALFGARDRYYTIAFQNATPGNIIISKEKRLVDLAWTAEVGTSSFSSKMYLGPQDISILKQNNIEKIIYYGIFNPIGLIILKGLYFFFSVFKNWGVSILTISTLIYLLLFPLTAQSTKSIKKMQELQPLMEDLKAKHKDNPQKLNKDVLGLYKDNKVNPLGGCLPMILQIPIFFALYQVLIRSIEIKGAHFLWINDLSKQDYFLTFPSSWPKLPVIGDGLHLLPLAMTAVMFLQQKFTSPQGAQSSDQQKMMTTIFPLFFGVIFYNFPSGLVLYWLTNSTFTFLYQYRLMKLRQK